ncbi:MAG TPA: hypothetical protein VHG91_01275, partial [Longimicrobium sp.]|nr:hypothetical protein [Longimicrobium sp.]
SLRAAAAAASFAILLYYGVANLAAWRMPAGARLYPRFVPALGLVACGVLAAALPPRTALAGVAVLAAGFVVRALVRGLARTERGD